MRKKKGRIVMISGGMMSGKTEELIRQVKRYVYAKKNVQVFKPSIDDRYDEVYIVSHSGEKIKGVPINDVRDIMHHLKIDTDVVAIEEVQFFNQEYTINVVKSLRDMGINVVCAGLDMDFTGEPFGVVPYLMAIAHDVIKLQAICLCCGEEAYISYRTNESKDVVQVGASESYTPLCFDCYCKKHKK